jgi:DNA-binding beta-propeller fold protein YncE
VNHQTRLPLNAKTPLFYALVTVILAGTLELIAQSGSSTLRKVTEYDLPGPAGKRFDYLTIDPDDGYLIAAHLAAQQTYVIDLKTNRVVATVADTPGAEGVEYVPGFNKFYTSNAYDSTISVVDLKQMKVIKKLKTGAKPNGTAYAAPFHKLYVSDTLARAVAVVDVEKDVIVKTLEFNSETGMPQYDSVSRKVYVNLRNTNEVAEIDPANDAVLGTYPVEGCRYNHGMAVDSEHHRAFLLCNGTKTLTVFALDTHKAIAHLPLPPGADVVKFDPGLGRIYAACSSGFISVFQAEGRDHYRKLEDFVVQKMVHSLAVDPATHRLYTPEQQENGQPVARMVVYDAVTAAQKH